MLHSNVERKFHGYPTKLKPQLSQRRFCGRAFYDPSIFSRYSLDITQAEITHFCQEVLGGLL